MTIEQGRRQIGDLAADLRLAGLQSLDRLIAGDGHQRIRRFSALQRIANIVGLRLGIGPLATHPRQFGGNVAQLLRGEVGRFTKRHETRRGPVLGDLLLRLPHLLAQVGDLRLEPAGGV